MKMDKCNVLTKTWFYYSLYVVQSANRSIISVTLNMKTFAMPPAAMYEKEHYILAHKWCKFADFMKKGIILYES